MCNVTVALIRNSAGRLGPGLDIRGDGGYVVVPPSIHPSGAAYEFIDESAPIAHAPAWFLSMLTKNSVLAKPTISIETPRPETIPEGRRNETLFGHAASMRRRGMNVPAVEAALLAENTFCSPPLDEVEVRAIAQSASRYEQVAPLVRTKVQNRSREWPASLAEEAFHGIAGEFVRLVRPETEADDAALLFSVLVALGSIIGRGPYYQVGGDRHYTNLFAVIVGESAKARKGTSWGEVRRFVDLVDEHWCKERVAGGLSSGEGLIDAVRDPIVQTVPQHEGRRIVGYESQKRPSKYKGYSQIWRDYFKLLCSSAWMRKVRTHHIQRWLEEIALLRKISKTTLAHAKNFLSGVFRYAAQQGYFDWANPVKLAEIPGFAAKGAETRPYSLEEIAAMLTVLPEPSATAVATAAFSGLRLGELRGLTWDSYEPEGG